MTGRIPWSTYSGEEIEKAVATYIFLENQDAERIRPSQGDRGIDLMVRKDDGVVVYQIKKFATNLTSSHKRQIEESWHTLQGYVVSSGITLLEWHLVMPLDPTPENHDWFLGLGKASGVKMVWDGLARVESWAATMPEVADYFFAGGKEAEKDEIAQLMEIARLSDVRSPEELESQLIALQQRMDHISPFYSFSVSVRSGHESGPLALDPRPGIVMSFMEEIVGGGAIVVDVFAKFREAVSLHPIAIQIASVAGDESSRKAFEDLLGFGEPMRDVPAVLKEADIDLPLPFASRGVEGLVTAFPLEKENVADCALLWNDVLSIPLEREYGHSGELGFRWGGHDKSGLLRVSLEQDSRKDYGVFSFNMGITGLKEGWDPKEAKRTLAFLSMAHLGDVDFVINGKKAMSLPFEQVDEQVDLITALTSFVDDMLVISETASEGLRFPPAMSILDTGAEALRRDALFLRAGCAVHEWDDLSIGLRDPEVKVDIPMGPTMVSVVSPFSVKVAERTIRCGLVQSLFVGILSRPDGGVSIHAEVAPEYGNALIRSALPLVPENAAAMNQILVGPLPSPADWASAVESTRMTFRESNAGNI